MNQLLILDMLLEERSPTRVAERLHVSQPAISASLRSLRTFFGDPLFVQSGRKMTPTPFAQNLAGPTREILLRADGLTRMRPRTEVANYERTVKIAASDFIAAVVLAPILREATTEAPGLKIELVSVFDSRHHYHEDLDRGDVDILIVPRQYASPDHETLALIDEIYVCIACRRNRQASKSMSLAEYLAAGHVGVANRTIVGQTLDEVHLSRLGHVRRIEVVVPSQMWIPGLIVGTKRLATVHSLLAEDLSERWPVKIIPCPADIPPLREVVQWHRYQGNDPAISWMRDKLMAASMRLRPGKIV